MTTSEITSAVAANPDYARLQLGTAPDSWGIWFPDDPQQPHWSVFLDEVVEAGFRTIELGPFGYLPTNPEQLKDELGKRGLSLTAGTVGAATHRGHDAFEASRRDAFEVCELLAAMDVEHLVVLPEMFTDLQTGELNQPAELTAEQWRDLVDGQNRLGRMVKEQFDIQLGFHPHVDSHVETQQFIDTFLQDTDPECGGAVSGHRPRRVLRRGQPRDRPAPSRPDQLHPPQAGQPRRRGQGTHRSRRILRSGATRRHGGAPTGRPRHEAPARRPRRVEPRPATDHRAGHVSGQARQRQGDRHPHPAVLHQHRPTPGRALISTTTSQRKEHLT